MQFKKNAVFCLLTLALLAAAGLTPAAAQETARITGRVMDANGDGVAGVVVRFEPVGDMGSPFEVTANKKGRFTYPAAPIGTFEPVVQGNWYGTRVKAKALDRISIAGAGEMDVTLAPGERAPGIPWAGGARMQVEVWVAEGRASGGGTVTGLEDASPALQELTALFDAQDWAALADRSATVIAENPELGGAHYLRAVGLWQTGTIVDAVDAMRRALELIPDQPGINGTLATLLLTHGRGLKEAGNDAGAAAVYSEAADLFQAQLVETPDEIVYLTNRVVALDFSGRHDQLAAAIETLLLVDDTNPNAYLRLAELHVANGDIDAAIATLDSMPEGGESAASIIYNAAVDLWNDGQLEAAAAVADRGIQMAPDLPDFYRLKAMALITSDQPQAVQLLDKYLSMIPEDAEGIEADRELVEALRARLEG